MTTYRQFTVSPRDESMPFDEAKRIIGQVPGVRVADLDPKSRIVIIDVPEQLSAEVQGALESRFLVDPNAPLRY